MAEQATPDLERARYIALKTFRRDGRAVSTPVWLVSLDGNLYVGTPGQTGKVKRLRNNPHVEYAVCDATGRRIEGPWHAGTGRLEEDPAVRRRVQAAMKAKYGWQYRLIVNVWYRLTGRYAGRVLIRVEPA